MSFQAKVRGLLAVSIAVLGLFVGPRQPICAEKLDYGKHPARVDDPNPSWIVLGTAQELTDGFGAQPYPVAAGGWVQNASFESNPATVVFDYGSPIKVAALGHYFYVPGCRDHRFPYVEGYGPPRASDWLSGPSAFSEVKIYTSDDKEEWKEVAHLSHLSEACPPLLKITDPTEARYLKLEVFGLVPGAGYLRSYEIETYAGTIRFVESKTYNVENNKMLCFTLPAAGTDKPLTGKLEVRVNGEMARWMSISGSEEFKASCMISGAKLDLTARFTKAGLLLGFDWSGPKSPRYSTLDVAATMDSSPTEWCVPGYVYSRTAPEQEFRISTPVVTTCAAIISDTKNALTIVPDTDQSWIGLRGNQVFADFPLAQESPHVYLLASKGAWFSGFERAVTDVFDFNEPRQYLPSSQAIDEISHFLLSSRMWSEKYQMLRAFPDVDCFHIFYGVPYAVTALGYCESMMDDPSVAKKVDDIISFSLARRAKTGPMKGAIFSQYMDKDIGWLPKDLAAKYPNEQISGLDLGGHRWYTSHVMGSVLWSVTQAWRTRGKIDPDVLAGAKEVADWIVSHQGKDGSWPYAYLEDGSVTSPQPPSSTIWNIWSLYRFGKLTGNTVYSKAAEKGKLFFKKTFIANTLYAGYWEDNYTETNKELNTTQGYEASIAALAFAEMGDNDAMARSAEHVLRFICTRQLECRTYWTSYGGASEQQGWAPGTYITTTIGRAAQVAWQRTGRDTFRRFSGLAKAIGWWQDPKTGCPFWLQQAIFHQPIEMYHEGGGDRSFWALWDGAQKVSFVIPWLIDEVNYRSGGSIKLSTETLTGTDDLGANVAVKIFEGKVSSTSGQVNWIGLRPKQGGYQLVLINHAEATDVSIQPPFKTPPASARLLSPAGRKTDIRTEGDAQQVRVHLPERSIAVVVWSE